MGRSTAPERPLMIVGDIKVASLSFVNDLDSGELLTGTPTIVEQTTSDLTITNKAVSTAELEISDLTVAIGMAVQCKISGQLAANSPYTVKITVVTDGSPAQTKNGYFVFVVEA